MSDAPGVSSSEPIYKAAAQIGTVIATVLGAVGGAVQLGVVSSDQAETINEIGTQVTSALPELAGAITLIVGVVSGIAASVMTAWSARKQVRPLDSDVVAITPAGPSSGSARVGGSGTAGEHRRLSE